MTSNISLCCKVATARVALLSFHPDRRSCTFARGVGHSRPNAGVGVLIELDKRALQPREVECPNCKARILFRRARSSHIDEQGFESYAFNCSFCQSCLVGVIDPRDCELLLSIAADKVEGSAAPAQWRRVLPLAGLAVAAIVNVLWVGALGYALMQLL